MIRLKNLIILLSYIESTKLKVKKLRTEITFCILGKRRHGSKIHLIGVILKIKELESIFNF